MVFIEEFSASMEDDFESVMKVALPILKCKCKSNLKVVVVGDGGVGKSSLIQRFCKVYLDYI